MSREGETGGLVGALERIMKGRMGMEAEGNKE